MNTFDNETTEAPNANDFIGGNYLKKEDVDGAITATLTDVWSEAVLNAGRKKLVVSFREFEKPLILNKTNIKRFARIFGTGDTKVWRGPVTIYVEPGVERRKPNREASRQASSCRTTAMHQAMNAKLNSSSGS